MNEQPKTTVPIKKNKNHKKWLIPLVVSLLVIGVAIASLTAYTRDYDKSFPNIYVGDTSLEGKDYNEILAFLDETYSNKEIKGATIPLVCNDNAGELSIDDLSVEYNNKETADLIFNQGRKKNSILDAFSFVYHSVVRTEIVPQISYNTDVLASAIDDLVSPYEIEPINYTFDIKPDEVIIYGKIKGVKADRDKLVAQIESQIRNMSFERVEIIPQDIDPEPLDFNEFYKLLTSKPEDAYYEKNEENKVVIHPGKLKCVVDKKIVENALASVDSSPENKVSFPVTTEAPEITTQMLTDTLYKDVLGSYKSYYSGAIGRRKNVEIATSRVNGLELMPGEEFSYSKTILPRTAANGYSPAPVYIGNKTESGWGGGICQPSSTLYCAALYANLEILERHNHSMEVGYVPAGMDATISEGALDLRLKNNTDYPIKIEGITEGGLLTFNIYGYNPDNYSVEIIRGFDGSAYQVTRVVKKDNKEVKRERMTSSKYVPHAVEEPEEKPEENPEETPETPTVTDGVEPPADGAIPTVDNTPSTEEDTPVIPSDEISIVPSDDNPVHSSTVAVPQD